MKYVYIFMHTHDCIKAIHFTRVKTPTISRHRYENTINPLHEPWIVNTKVVMECNR